ncbi:MAG: MBL fold metallo-hydrolase [Candidatus Fervidibacter sp.]|uniref:MBL fold metallo-hydrolase n=1 Tax=Candidatus Fervidibacter sp. TaxID=3100871 RepID=UPI00404B758F
MSLRERVERLQVSENCIAIWGLGQTGVVLKGAGLVVYIDPYLTGEGRRAVPIVIKPDEVNHADFVFHTHIHIDHLDPETVRGIAKASPKAKFIAPLNCHQVLRMCGVSEDRIIHPPVKQVFDFGALKFFAIPSAHYGFDEVDGKTEFPSYLGYCITLNGVKVYHAGDTILYDGMEEHIRNFAPDIAFLPINGRDYYREKRNIIGNLTFWEAARLVVNTGVKLVIPTHWDMFPHNSENFARFADWLYHNARDQHFHVLHAGELFVYMKEG